ncbi:phenylalanine--tRNA ligase subunit alpha [bacterium]|nr:phenylalanine--tRNA ligase subunit alpha [bacterium]
MSVDLNQIKVELVEALENAENLRALDEIRVAFRGQKGKITLLSKSIKDVAPENRASFGKDINELKDLADSLIEKRKTELFEKEVEQQLESEWIDVTISKKDQKGHLHPLTQIQNRIEDIFTSMGFIVLDGPETESEYNNFEALNIPKDHPARDMQDTFWTTDGNLLRTHTSCIQVRGMKKLKPPFKVIAPGRVFRYEAIDASHENTFYQVEGMVVDKEISVANLISSMRTLLREVFEKDVKVRLRPGYFPFVEPGFELDISCLICGGSGCSVCKQSGWVELLPCGLVHPNVLKAGGIDPNEYSGFAFGLGLNRLVMMKYGINDIRHFQSGDLRFVRQF